MDFPHLKFKSYHEAVVNDVLLYAMSTCGYTLEEQIVALVNDRQRLVALVAKGLADGVGKDGYASQADAQAQGLDIPKKAVQDQQ